MQKKAATGWMPPSFRPTDLIVHYNEVGLKGRNRSWFEERLVDGIRRAIAGASAVVGSERSSPAIRVARMFGRIVVHLDRSGVDRDTWSPVVSAVSRVFGVAYVLPVASLEPRLDALTACVSEVLSGQGGSLAFAVQCKRSTKDFPFTSMQLQRELGARIQSITGWPVNLDHPECTVRVECVNKAAFLGFARFAGPGGLPTGVGGKVACLLSGGIDSPVAAYRLLRRGATATFVHFHSHPHTGIESQEKVQDLAEIIQPPGVRSRLYMVPFAPLQREIAARCSAPLRVLLYRRFMLRVAEAIGRAEGALALVTGENLGQVASQTLENLRALDAVASLPVLRPLVGLDKLEIIAEARLIGTFAVSTEPHDDCCSFLMPRNPATYSRPQELEHEEQCFDVADEVQRLVTASEVREVTGRIPVHSGDPPMLSVAGDTTPPGGRPIPRVERSS